VKDLALSSITSETGMIEQSTRNQNPDGTPSWIIAVFTLIGMAGIGLIFVLPGGGFMPLATAGRSIFPVALFIIAITFIVVGFISTGKKLLRLSKEIPARLELLGVQFGARVSGAIAAKIGTYKDLKLEFALRLAQKGSPDCFILTIFHPKRLNLGLLCTNVGQFRFGKQVPLPFYKAIGARALELPGYTQKTIKCWAADLANSKNIFYDDHLKTALVSLDEILERYEARFVLDDNALKMAIGTDKVIDGTVLEAARTLITEFAQSGKLPQNPPPVASVEKYFQFVVMGIMAIFIGLVVFIIING
jgi:hypothetical protein